MLILLLINFNAILKIIRIKLFIGFLAFNIKKILLVPTPQEVQECISKYISNILVSNKNEIQFFDYFYSIIFY